jgi:hypothetical protein
MICFRVSVPCGYAEPVIGVLKVSVNGKGKNGDYGNDLETGRKLKRRTGGPAA